MRAHFHENKAPLIQERSRIGMMPEEFVREERLREGREIASFVAGLIQKRHQHYNNESIRPALQVRTPAKMAEEEFMLMRSHNPSYVDASNLSPKEKKILLKRFPQPTSQLVASEPRSPSNRSRVADAYNQMVTSPQHAVTSQGEGMEMLRKQIEQSGEFVVVRKEEVEGLKKEGKKSEKASSKQQDKNFTRSKSRSDEDDNWRRKSSKSSEKERKKSAADEDTNWRKNSFSNESVKSSNSSEPPNSPIRNKQLDNRNNNNKSQISKDAKAFLKMQLEQNKSEETRKEKQKNTMKCDESGRKISRKAKHQIFNWIASGDAPSNNNKRVLMSSYQWESPLAAVQSYCDRSFTDPIYQFVAMDKSDLMYKCQVRGDVGVGLGKTPGMAKGDAALTLLNRLANKKAGIICTEPKQQTLDDLMRKLGIAEGNIDDVKMTVFMEKIQLSANTEEKLRSYANDLCERAMEHPSFGYGASLLCNRMSWMMVEQGTKFRSMVFQYLQKQYSVRDKLFKQSLRPDDHKWMGFVHLLCHIYLNVRVPNSTSRFNVLVQPVYNALTQVLRADQVTENHVSCFGEMFKLTGAALEEDDPSTMHHLVSEVRDCSLTVEDSRVRGIYLKCVQVYAGRWGNVELAQKFDKK